MDAVARSGTGDGRSGRAARIEPVGRVGAVGADPRVRRCDLPRGARQVGAEPGARRLADAVRLADEAELAGVISSLLADPGGASALGERARQFARRQDGALDALWPHLQSMMPQ